MSGTDFYDKATRATIVSPSIGPEMHPDGEGGTDAQKTLAVTEQGVQSLLKDILCELRAIHFHLSEMTENDMDTVRRDC